MNLNEQLDDNFGQEELGIETRRAFQETAKWTNNFTIIIGIIFGLILLLFGVMVLSGGRLDEMIVALLMFLFCGIPFYYLYQFTTKTKKALEDLDDVLFTSALQNLKSFFKFWGVLTLLLLAYYVVIILFLFINISASF